MTIVAALGGTLEHVHSHSLSLSRLTMVNALLYFSCISRGRYPATCTERPRFKVGLRCSTTFLLSEEETGELNTGAYPERSLVLCSSLNSSCFLSSCCAGIRVSPRTIPCCGLIRLSGLFTVCCVSIYSFPVDLYSHCTIVQSLPEGDTIVTRDESLIIQIPKRIYTQHAYTDMLMCSPHAAGRINYDRIDLGTCYERRACGACVRMASCTNKR